MCIPVVIPVILNDAELALNEMISQRHEYNLKHTNGRDGGCGVTNTRLICIDGIPTSGKSSLLKLVKEHLPVYTFANVNIINEPVDVWRGKCKMHENEVDFFDKYSCIEMVKEQDHVCNMYETLSRQWFVSMSKINWTRDNFVRNKINLVERSNFANVMVFWQFEMFLNDKDFNLIGLYNESIVKQDPMFFGKIIDKQLKVYEIQYPRHHSLMIELIKTYNATLPKYDCIVYLEFDHESDESRIPGNGFQYSDCQFALLSYLYDLMMNQLEMLGYDVYRIRSDRPIDEVYQQFVSRVMARFDQRARVNTCPVIDSDDQQQGGSTSSKWGEDVLELYSPKYSGC